MPIYQKKPIEVEAVRWLGTAESFSLILAAFPQLPWHPGPMGKKEFYLDIADGNGDNRTVRQTAACGDYIVKESNGNYMVYKASVFHETHELVKELHDEQSNPTQE